MAERGSARTTTSVPAGVVGSRSATRCRSRRRTRFRTTALPMPLDTTKPTKIRVSGTRSACNTKVGRVTRTPDRMVRWKSAERVIRAFLGSTGVVDCFRRKASRDPCAGGQPQWRGLLGSASEDGNHAFGCDAGCSAGTCACSRESSHNWLVAGGRRLQESALDAGVSDLLTVRGPAKPVKPDRRLHQSRLSVLCPADTLKINEETMASLALPQRHC
jgi:hypothetical protein